MTKLVPVLVVFMLILLGGVLWMVATVKPESDAGLLPIEGGPPMPVATASDRDNPNETLRTLTEMQERMQKTLEQQSDNNRSTLESYQSENDQLRTELKQLRDEFKLTLDQELQSFTDANTRLTESPGTMPSGIGYDDFDYHVGVDATKPVTAPLVMPVDQYVSVAPVGFAVDSQGTAVNKSSNQGGLLDKATGMLDSLGNTLRPDAFVGENRHTSARNVATKPVFTINNQASLVANTTMTALMGKVPAKNNVIDPFRFKVITGSDNLAASSLRLPPGIAEIIWSGFSVGNREMSCVRGWVDTVTLVFRDGTISTTTTRDNTNSTKSVRSLGYISDPWGKPCISGKLFSNADDYLKDRAFMATLAAVADAAASAETSSIVNNDSFVNSITGDKGDFVLGKSVSGFAGELLSYFRDRMANAFDVVFIPTGMPLSIHVEAEIEFDYDPNGRKIDHGFYLQQAASHTQFD